MRIIDVCARWPGSAHDATIYRNSEICHRFERGEFGPDSALLGDSAYAVGDYLCKPLENAITDAEKNYQNSQTQSQNVVERTFGVLKRKFPCLALGLDIGLERVQDVIVACCILHNILRLETNENANYMVSREEIEFQDDVAVRLGLERQNQPITIQNILISNHFHQ